MGTGCFAGLECMLGIFKAVSMGSCLSSDSGGGRSSLSSSSTGPGSPGSGLKKAKKGGGMRQGSSTDELHRIPGRMFLNGASSIASLFTQQGTKGTNQDAMIVWENFGSTTGAVFCGVFDGHGPYGHIVARRVRDCLPLKLSANWEVNLGGDELRQNSISTNGSMNLEELVSAFIEDKSRASIDLDDEKFPEVFSTLKESFLKACKVMDKELKLHPSIDCFYSGTTAVTLVKQGEHLVIGNVGDSRAVLATRGQNDCLVAVQLTVDLKPNLPKEAERIQQCKGRVFALKDEPEVARVWLPNYDSPGLAMARAFGDFCLKDFGVISVPEISYHRITEKDEFIVLATDGVWDVLSNKEVVDIVASAPAQCSSARSLVQHAVRAWRFKYPTSKVDDCAAVCLFFNAGDPPKEPVIKASYADADKQERIAPSTFEHCGTTRCSQIVQGNSCTGSRSQLHQQMPGVNPEATENTLPTMPMFVEGEKQQSAGTMAQKK